MKKIILALISFTVLTACNRTKEIKIVEPPKELILNVVQNIDGDLGQFSSAKNEKIKISFKKNEDEMLPGIEYKIPVKIIFSSASDIKAGRGNNDYGPSMEIEFLDKEGKKIEDCSALMTSSYTDLASLVKAGNYREEWVNFTGRYIVNSLYEDKSLEKSKAFIDAISKASSIRIKSKIIAEETDTNPNENVANSESSSNSSSSGNCDEFLDGYEKFMEKYIVVLKKYKDNPTDPAILSDYTSLMTDAQNWATKTKDCAADPAFSAKFVAIQMKIANAMR
jgi:hypothetical protein